MPRHGDLASRSEPRGIAKHRAESMDQANERGGAARRTGCCAYESRWLCLAAGCAMKVCAGAVYSFGSVAEDLKQNLELKDAHEQGLISIAGNLGLWIGSFTGGLLADARGPRTSMLGGAALFFVGYGAMYLALSHRVTFLRDPTVVAFFYLLAGLGSGWVMNSAMFTNTQNWEPARRAKVVSILATLMGAAATIWSTLFTGCLGGHAELSHDVTAAAGSTASLGGSAPPVLGGLAISSAPHAYSYAHEVEFVLPAGSEAGGGGGGNAHGAPRYGCAGGWVNGDVASFFGLLALALPTITLFGAWASFRMENEQQRRYADVQDGGDEAVARRLAHGIRTLLAILLVVGLCSVLAVVFDGDAAAVRVNEWGPLLMLSLLALLVALLGGQRDLVEKYWGIWSSDTGGAQGDLAVLLNKSSEAASTASAAQAKPVAAAAAHTPRTALVTIEFWLVFCVMATVCGSNSATMVSGHNPSVLFSFYKLLRLNSATAHNVVPCVQFATCVRTVQNVISTIIDDRHAGSRVVARITNVLLMTTSSLIRIVSGQLMAAAPNRPVHVWIVLMSSIASVIGQGLFTVSFSCWIQSTRSVIAKRGQTKRKDARYTVQTELHQRIALSLPAGAFSASRRHTRFNPILTAARLALRSVRGVCRSTRTSVSSLR